METSESEPLMTCRNELDEVKTEDGGSLGMSVGGVLKPGPHGFRLEGGVNLDQALVRNRRTCRPDVKGDGQASDPRETQSTDAGHRGRTARSVCWAAPRSGGFKSHWRSGRGRHIQRWG